MKTISKRDIWTGRIFTGLVTAVLLGSGIAKIAGAPRMVDGLTRAGIPRNAIIPIAILELTCLALYLAPRTAALGALLLTGYFGGAIVTHIIGGESIAPLVIIGLMIWAGAWFRTAELQELFPLKKGNDMERLSNFAPWINRLVLLGATFIFTMIGLRYIANPVRAAAATGVTLGSGLAATTTRVGLGGFPLAFAIFSFVCLLSSRRLRTGVWLVLTVAGAAFVVRLFSLAADGPAPESVRLFVPEAAILLLAAAGLILESARLRRQTGDGV
jgi:hypothetical protein